MAIATLDHGVANLARLVTNGPIAVEVALTIVRLRERHPVEEVIATLSTIGTPSPAP